MAAASTTATLLLNAQQFKKGLEDAKKQMLKFSNEMKSAGQNLSLAVAAPLAILSKNALDAAVNFDLVQAKIGGLSGRSGPIKYLSDEAKRLGAETIFTATQVGELQLALRKLGINVVTIGELTPVVIKFAQALDQDLATAGEFLVTLLNKMPDSFDQFTTKTERATYAAEGIAYAVANSALTVEGLQNSLNYVGAEADAAGLSFDKTVAILGALANAGYTGSRAGTQLRRILVELTGTADTTEGAFDQFIAKGLAFEDVIEAVGIRAAGMGAALQGQGPKIEAFAEGLRNSAGNLDIFSAALDDTLFAKFKLVESAVEAMGIAFVESVEEPLKSLLTVFAQAIRGIAEFPKPVKIVIAVITALAIAIPPLVLAIATLKVGLIQLGITTTVFGATLSAAIPIVAAAGAAILLITGYMSGAKGEAGQLADQLKDINYELELLVEQKDWVSAFEASEQPLKDARARIELMNKEMAELLAQARDVESQSKSQGDLWAETFSKTKPYYDRIREIQAGIRAIQPELDKLAKVNSNAFYMMAAQAAIARDEIKRNPITIKTLRDEYNMLYRAVINAQKAAKGGSPLDLDAMQKSIDRMNELRSQLALYGVEVRGLDKEGKKLEESLGTAKVAELKREYISLLTQIQALQAEGATSPVSLDELTKLQNSLTGVAEKLALLGVSLDEVEGSNEFNASIKSKQEAVKTFIDSINDEADQILLTPLQLVEKRFEQLRLEYANNAQALIAIEKLFRAEMDRLQAEDDAASLARWNARNEEQKAAQKDLYDTIFGYALNFTTALTQSINDVVAGTKTFAQALKENLISALNRVLAKVLALIVAFTILNILSGGTFALSGTATNILGGQNLGQFIMGGMMPKMRSMEQSTLKVEGFVSGSNLVIANRRGVTAIDRIYG